MTTRIEEGFLCFLFDDTWNVIKYDNDTDYQEKIRKLKETKAIDIIGIHENKLYFLEIKDFRKYRIENQPRLLTGELVTEVAQKARDTIAGIIAGNRTSNQPNKWKPFVRFLSDRSIPIHVILWLEYDLPIYQQAREKVKASVRNQELKKAVGWLTTHALITGMSDNVLGNRGLNVSNLPRA